MSRLWRNLRSLVGSIDPLRRVRQRLQLSLAKHPSLTGHPRMARRLARLIPAHRHEAADFYATDGAPAVNLTQLASGANALAVGAVDAGRALVLEQYDAPGGPPACAVAVYDIRTRARRELSRGASACVDVPWALSGDLAVVERSPVGASDLWLYDLRGGAPRQVTRHSRRSTGARLAGSWLVWTDDRNDQWDLYAMDLTDLDRGDFSPEGVTP